MTDLSRKLRLTLSVLFLLLAFSGISTQSQSLQNIKFYNISIKNGLSQSSANCIMQDSRGIMWIGTEDGLNKYDGYNFTVYRPDGESSISHSRILCILEDLTGDLWIGTNGGGLNKYDRKNDKFSRINSQQSGTTKISLGNVISSLYSMKDQLWVGSDHGIGILNTTTGKLQDFKALYPEFAELDELPVHAIVSKDQIIWIGTSKGLFRFDLKNRSFSKYLNDPQDPNSLPDNNVTALLINRSGRLIIGTQKGVSQLDQKANVLTFITLPNTGSSYGSNSSVKALLEDDQGLLWIATMGNGLFIGSLETGHFTNFVYDHLNPYSIKNNEVLSLFRDYSGLIWVGTNGIDIYNPKKDKFVLYDYIPFSTEQLVFRNIHPIYEDNFNVLWIGSKTDGLHVLDRNNHKYSHWTRNNPANALSSSRVRAIKEYPQGVLWIGTEDQGLDKIYLDGNRKPIKSVNYKSIAGDKTTLTSNKIYAIYPDRNGSLWIGTDNGLSVMNIETGVVKQYLPDTTDSNSISNTTVYAIYGDNNNNIWLATDLGVNKYNRYTDGFVHFIHSEKNRNTVIHNEILCFLEDSRHNIWIGTYGKGMDKLDPVKNTFTHFTDIPEIASAVIYGILEDDQGNMWMSSNNGIIKFNETTRALKIFNIEDGLQSNEFNGTSYMKNRQGEMFFGGQYGFNSFYPQEVKVDTVAPKVVFSDLLVMNNSVVPGKNSPITNHITEAKEIILDYRQNNFTIYFSALHFANPERNKYQYKLEGFDEKWIDAGNKRFASYTNLPYKTYTFRVKAANNDGIWNEKGISIKIRVKPPFWATILFKIFTIMVIGALIYFIIRRQLTINQRNQKIIEEKFHASSLELEEARAQMQTQHDEIVIQKRELVQRQKDQENMLWFNQGLGKFSDLISKNRENLQQLCKEFIENLVDYVEAQQGGVFLFNDDESVEQPLELTAYYAFSSSRLDQKFAVGEGYVGSCFKEKKFLEIDNLSENYSELSSGLGSMHVKHLVLAPLIVNADCIGVIEIGSFKKVKGYRISFIEKLCETVASTIMTEQSNKKLKHLIDRSSKQAQELSANEELLRKNLEEIMSAHEESSRREDELIKLAEESATREEMLTQEIEELKCKIESLTSQQSAN